MNLYKYDQLDIGTEASFSKEITSDLLDAFCRISGDTLTVLGKVTEKNDCFQVATIIEEVLSCSNLS